MFTRRTLKHAMATTKTKIISVRVPAAVLAAVTEDAADFNMTPGAFLREMLERRYSSPRVAQSVDKTD